MLVLHALVALATVAAALPRPVQRRASNASAQYLSATTDDWINDTLAAWGSPGLGVAVVQLQPDGSWSREVNGYGVADATGGAIHADTLFEIGSNTKLFTVVATGLLAANQSIQPTFSFSTKAKDLIPGWKLMDPVASELVNIQDLMSHRTGMPRHDYMLDPHTSALDAVALMRYLKPSEELRQGYQYDNLAYTTLSTLPSILTGTPFVQYITENIIDPLGLNSTTYSYADALATGHLAQGFTRVNLSEATIFSAASVIPQGLSYLKNLALDNELAGSGGIMMSSNDAATWLQALLLDGRNPSTNVSVVPLEVLADAATGVTVVYGSALYPRSPLRSMVAANLGTATAGWKSSSMEVNLPPAPSHEPTLMVVASDPRPPSSTHTSSPTPTPRPINASSPVPFTSLADSYSNPAYGSVELCLIPSSKQSTSAACKSLKASLPTVLPNVLDSSIPTLVGTVDRLWNYLVLASFDGGIYNASLIGSSPPVGSTGPNTVQVVQSGVGEFAFDSNSTGGTVTGFGLSGVWGANTTAEPTGTTVEARSEVFYTKH